MFKKVSKNILKRDINFYEANGFLKLNIFNKADVNALNNRILKKFDNTLKKIANNRIKIHRISDYHKSVKSEKIHKMLTNPDLRFLKLSHKITKKIMNNRILNVLNYKWGHKKIVTSWIGNLEKNQLVYNATGFRIARPVLKSNQDAAGVHLDINAGGQIRKDKNALVTIWIPLIGFNKNYTLRFAPGSHTVNHTISFIKKKKITPVVEKIYEKKFKFVRPTLKIGQAILLHSNLLHGGSRNFGKKTRVSLDVRILNLKRFLN